MRFDRDLRRKIVNATMSLVALLCVVVAIIPLGSILYESVVQGAQVLSPTFFTAAEPNPCIPGVSCGFGGIYNALQGTLLLVLLSGLIALPIGILAGIYLAEFGRNRLGDTARFLADVLAGVPSIVVGIVVFSLFLILAQDGFVPATAVISLVSASVALAFIMIPIVARTSEEALRLVPVHVREAALALGIPKYRAVLRIVLSNARSAVLTGALLAVARAAGETAPLIILDGGNHFPYDFTSFPYGTTASLPFNIYYWIQSPYPNWHADAWGTTLVLVVLMLGVSVAARLALRNRFGGRV